MKNRKYFLIVSLLTVLAGGLMTACVIDEGDERPRRTQGEYEIYTNTYILNARAIEHLRMVVGFNAYLSQTTDVGRAAVVNRFFSWAKVIASKEYGWRMQDDELATMYYDFLIKDGALLDQPGASWLVYCRYSSSQGVDLIASLTNESGAIRYKGVPVHGFREAEGWVDWLIDVTLTETDFAVEAAGSSGFTYKIDNWRENEVWTVDSSIDSPLLWADSKRCFFGGKMAVSAVLMGPSPRTIKFEAEQLPREVRIIAEDGVVEIWD